MSSRRTRLSREDYARIGALGAAAARAKREAESLPPEGWPSWPAFRRSNLAGARPHDPLAIRTFLEAASEMS